MSVSKPGGPAAIDLQHYTDGIRGGDRALLGRAITLIESQLPAHQSQAEALLTRLLPHSGAAARVGITGSPGVGKSTFIEALMYLCLRRDAVCYSLSV